MASLSSQLESQYLGSRVHRGSDRQLPGRSLLWESNGIPEKQETWGIPSDGPPRTWRLCCPSGSRARKLTHRVEDEGDVGSSTVLSIRQKLSTDYALKSV